MRIAEIRLCPYDLPLARPIVTARARLARRRGTLIWLRGDDGVWGVGDAAAWPGFGVGATALAAALGALPGALAGWSWDALLPVAGGRLPPSQVAGGWPSELVYALETAALDGWGQRGGGGLAELWGVPRLPHVTSHRQVATAFAAREAVAAGFGALKVKIGARRADDEILQVGAIRSAVGGQVALRLDANGAWEAAMAVRVARHLAAFSPAWLEQPVAAADIAGLAEVRRHGGVPVAADEAVTGELALAAIIAAEAADVVVLKPMYVGGLARARAMAQRSQAAGLQVVVTHALESAVGRLAARHLAASLPSAGAHRPVHGLGDCMASDVGVAAQPVVGAGPAICPIRPGAHWGLRLAAPGPGGAQRVR